MTKYSMQTLLGLVTLLISWPLMAQDARPPNVVIIMADDLGYRDVGCYGCIDFETPNIDALAASGVRCTEGYVSHPYCSPSRAGVLTGRYQQRFGHEHNPRFVLDDDAIGIDAGTQLLPALMRDAGYVTGLIGKWHLGAGAPFRPIERGFTEFYGFLGGGHDYFNANPDGHEYDGPLWRDGAPTDDSISYLTDDLTAEAEAFLERHQDEPLCLMLMYNAPHAPDQVTDEYMARVADIEHMGRRRYAALVQGVDEGVGRVVSKLDKLGLTENTLVIFLSDNGGRRSVSDNRPLRGNKGWLDEGGIRVPFILSLPGTLAAGAVYEKPVSALDLLPTAMAFGGVALPDGGDGTNGVDGVSLLPYLLGENEESPHETMYWRVSGGDGFAVRRGQWKLVQDIAMGEAKLYDLANDPGEDEDLAKRYPDKLAALMQAYEDWVQELESPRWADGHTAGTTKERDAANKAGSRQYPMPWVR